MSPDSSQSFLAGLPPALRACVEANAQAGLDLVPWIDPKGDPPPRPIDQVLTQFLHGQRWPDRVRTALFGLLGVLDVYEPQDLTAARLQYAVWCLREDHFKQATIEYYLHHTGRFTAYLKGSELIDEDPLSWVQRRSWAKGEFGQLCRISQKRWRWLRRYEREDSAGYHNCQAILADSGDAFGATDRRKALQQIRNGLLDARLVRDGPAGLSTAELRRWMAEQPKGPGSFNALCELFCFWRSCQIRPRDCRARWNTFPRRIMEAIAGRNEKYLRKIPPGAKGRSLMEKRIGLGNRGASPEACPGIASGGCPRSQEFLRQFEAGRGESAILSDYGKLDLEQRKLPPFCAEHVRMPRTSAILRSQVSRARVWRSGKTKVRNGIAAGEVQQPSLMVWMKGDPAYGLRGLKARKSRGFDEFCYQKRKVEGQTGAKLLDELLGMGEKDRREKFGGYWPLRGVGPGTRAAAYQILSQAVRKAKMEQDLAGLLEETEGNRDVTIGSAGSPPKKEMNVKPRKNKLAWLGDALVLVREHPDWSDRAIARSVEVSAGTLSRSPEYQTGATLARGKKADRPAGYRDSETGDFDAYGD